MTAAAPPPAAWQLALDGIKQLGDKIDAMAARQESFSQQAVQDRQNVFATTSSMERRIYELERGATAAILAHLAADVQDRAADVQDREARRVQTDRRDTRLTWAAVGLSLSIIALTSVQTLCVVLIWLSLRGGA